MSHALDSKSAAAELIDPFNAPEPSAETGPGAHFRSTFAPATASSSAPSSNQPTTTSTSAVSSPRSSLNTNNPFRASLDGKPHSRSSSNGKNGASSSTRPMSREGFPAYRAEAFFDEDDVRRRRSGSGHRPPPSYGEAVSGSNSPNNRHRRRTSSLRERYPGDTSTQPLEVLRKDSKKAHRSPHLKKHHLPGPDTVDRLDPAIGGRSYHHEGPYDAALLARNTSYENSPLAALETTNKEALKATPAENIKDAVDRHRPLEGVADVPPGMPDRFGRTYNYEEGADLMHEDNNDGPGYKRWPGRDYLPEDLKGESEPAFSLDRALKAHKITDEGGIELQENSNLMRDYERQKRDGSLDNRDAAVIAGSDARRADMEIANTRDNDASVGRSGSLRAGLKKRIGSLKKKAHHDE